MAYINEIPLPDTRAASLGERLGQVTFNRLSQNTDAMVQQKLNQLAKVNERKQLMQDINESGIFKDHPDVARLLPMLDPKDRGKFLTQWVIGQQASGDNNINPPTGAEMFAPGQQVQPQQQKPTQADILSRGAEILAGPQAKIAREGLELKKQSAIDKLYTKYNQDLTERAHSADNASRELGLQINLLKNGNLNRPEYIGALKSLGADWPFLIKGDTIALDKSAIALAQKNLKTNFGSRPTDFGFEKTLESVPNSLHNKNDALNLAYRIKASQDAEKVLFDTRNQIVEENGGFSPKNLPAKVEARAKDKLDSLSLQYNYALPSPEEAIQDGKPALYTYGKLFVTDGETWEEAKLTAEQRKKIEGQTSGKK